MLEERPRQRLAMRQHLRVEPLEGGKTDGVVIDGGDHGADCPRAMVALTGTSDSSIVGSDLEAALGADVSVATLQHELEDPGNYKEDQENASHRGVASWKSLRRTLIAALRVRADDEAPRRRPLTRCALEGCRRLWKDGIQLSQGRLLFRVEAFKVALAVGFRETPPLGTLSRHPGAVRIVPQKRHFTAAACTSSAQPGHFFISSMSAPLLPGEREAGLPLPGGLAQNCNLH